MSDHIQIGDISPRVNYTGDGTTVVFTYPFPVFQDADLEVYVDGTLQTLTTDYAISGAGVSGGGTATLVTAPSNGADVALVRRLAIKRTTDFQTSGEFRAKVINDELDFQTAALQQVENDVERSIRLNRFDPDATLQLPTAADRASKVLGFDGSGDLVALTPNTESYINASAFGLGLIDDTDAGAARTTLGLAIGTDVQAFDADILKADVTDTLTAGFLGQSYDLGNLSAATTLSVANGNVQHATMTGSFTLTAPDDTGEGYIELELTIDGTGGYALTLSGFNEMTGSADTTANTVNVLRISKLNTNTYLEIIQAV